MQIMKVKAIIASGNKRGIPKNDKYGILIRFPNDVIDSIILFINKAISVAVISYIPRAIPHTKMFS